MKKLLFVSLSLGAILFSGCQKEEPVRCILPISSIGASSPVISGDAIHLTIGNSSEAFTDATFEWSGPNNFYSNLPSPIISNASSVNAGEYKLKIKKGICETDEMKASVVVINNTVNCTQANDTANFTNFSSSSFSFYYNTSQAITNNEYEIHGGGSQLSTTAIFSGSTKPVTGLYTIVNKAIALTSGTVHLTCNNGSGSLYYAKSGDVMVKYDASGNAIVKFCSIPFSYSTNTSTDTVGSALFTQNQ